MTQNDRRGNICAALTTLVDMHVRTAHTAGTDPQQHLTFAGIGKIQRTNFDFLISKKISTNHCFNLRIISIKHFVVLESDIFRSQAV